MNTIFPLEEEIFIIGNQIDDAKKIQEIEKLFFETINKYESAKKDDLMAKVRKLSIGNFVFVIYKLREFYDEWGQSQISPNREELKSIERIIKEMFKVIDKINKADFPPYFSENHYLEAKKGLIELRIKIDEEK